MHLVELCYLFWQRNPSENPQEAELRDINSVQWKFMGTLLIPDDILQKMKSDYTIIK